MKRSIRERLAADEVCLGVSLRQARTADTARVLADCGYAWMFLDLEHGPLAFDQIVQLALAGVEAGVTPLVRVPDTGGAAIGRALSNGAMGVIVPHVEDPAAAAAVARHCRFPPLGDRAVPGAFPQLGYRPLAFAEAAAILNRETFMVAMIESPEAVEAAETIAAVDGVDCLFVGASDLTFAMGLPSRYDHPSAVAAFERVAKVARRHGKAAGIGGIADDALLRRCIDAGHRLILAGNDLALLIRGLRARATALGVPAG